MRTYRYLCYLLLLVGLVSSSGALADTTTPTGLASYVRYHNSAPFRLETGVVKMRAPQGQTLDLVSAVHLGDKSYYQQLNNQFTGYDAVLYELVLPESVAGQRLPSQMEASGGLSGIQSTLAKAMGLTTQLSGIDYSGSNFVHADLTQEALSASMASRQESIMSYFQKAMAKSGSLNSKSMGVTDQEMAELDFMALLSGNAKPSDRKTLKKLIASAMTQSDGLLTALGDSSLIGERNKAALKVLDQQIGKGRRTMALYYGAAHMPDLQTRLEQKGWKAESTDWLPAWSF